VSSSNQSEEEIGNASSENGIFIAKMEFSVRTGQISYEIAHDTKHSESRSKLAVTRDTTLAKPKRRGASNKAKGKKSAN
jgi:hypothetical protein